MCVSNRFQRVRIKSYSVFFFFFSCLLLSYFLLLLSFISPWYNHTCCLGVKIQLTLSFLACTTSYLWEEKTRRKKNATQMFYFCSLTKHARETIRLSMFALIHRQTKKKTQTNKQLKLKSSLIETDTEHPKPFAHKDRLIRTNWVSPHRPPHKRIPSLFSPPSVASMRASLVQHSARNMHALESGNAKAI